MTHFIGRIGIAVGAVATLLATSADAQLFGSNAVNNSASNYNNPYSMSQAQENAPVDASLRDANGNLTVVNGMFTSSTMSQQTGVQQSSVLGSAALGATLANGQATTGAGFGGQTTLGQATAIGNSLNVVTVGTGNTVIVNSDQTNNGNQTATVTQNGH
ncbi:MAG TPA: holdfast anchoring protein HfaA [Rhizomicrobium sp.]